MITDDFYQFNICFKGREGVMDLSYTEMHIFLFEPNKILSSSFRWFLHKNHKSLDDWFIANLKKIHFLPTNLVLGHLIHLASHPKASL
jgi:hypothetical protein